MEAPRHARVDRQKRVGVGVNMLSMLYINTVLIVRSKHDIRNTVFWAGSSSFVRQGLS